jgi:hypothetical protein
VPALLAACGGGSPKVATPKAKAAPSPARALEVLVLGDARLRALANRRARKLYVGGDWAVASVSSERRAYAAAFRLVNGRWRADLSRRVRVRILGPDSGSKADPTPQVAAEIAASAPLAESGLWVDGRALEVKGGGSPTRGTIYGAPPSPLAPGTHVAVAYGRTERSGTAVAWMFTVD